MTTWSTMRPRVQTLAAVGALLLAAGVPVGVAHQAWASRLDLSATGVSEVAVEACLDDGPDLEAAPGPETTVVVAGLSPSDIALCTGRSAALTLLTSTGIAVAYGTVRGDGLVLDLDDPEPIGQVRDAVLSIGGIGYAVRWTGPGGGETPQAVRCEILDVDATAPSESDHCWVQEDVHRWPGWWQVRVTVMTDAVRPVRWRVRLDLRADPFPFVTTDVGEYTGNAVPAGVPVCEDRVLQLVGVPQRSQTIRAGSPVSFQLVGTDGDTYASHQMLSCRG